MRFPWLAGALVICSLLPIACARPPQGGAAETQLAAATTAGDLAKVRQLLGTGADPNKVIEIDGRQQSAWFLALAALRARRSETVEIALAMLKAGANPRAVWGTDETGAQESFWQKFLGPSRQSGTGRHSPLVIAMRNPVPDVVRSLIATGFDPRDGGAVLESAVETGEVEIVHALVDAGVDVNTTAGAITPLLAAINTRNVALMTYLEEHGAREKP